MTHLSRHLVAPPFAIGIAGLARLRFDLAANP
jgi:hypothetical protein